LDGAVHQQARNGDTPDRGGPLNRPGFNLKPEVVLPSVLARVEEAHVGPGDIILSKKVI